MKRIIFLAALFPLLPGGILAVAAEEVLVSSRVVDGNTLITCAPAGKGRIDKAYISLYRGDQGQTERHGMEVNVDNTASYLLPGIPAKVEGRCKIFMLKMAGISTMPSRDEQESEVLTGEFLLSQE